MDDALLLTEPVARPGDVVETEPLWELTADALAFLAMHPMPSADAHV